MSKTKLLSPNALWDANSEGKSKIHFVPRRRGQAKITWPLAPKKALILLTGRTPLSRALDAYESFFRARRRTFRGMPRWAFAPNSRAGDEWSVDERVLPHGSRAILPVSAQGIPSRRTKKENFKTFIEFGVEIAQARNLDS